MKKSFTIIELLISLGILAILAGVVLLGPQQGPESLTFRNAVERVASEIQKTQGFALAVKDFNGTPSSGGWGVYVEKTKNCTIIFADANNNQVYDPAGEASGVCDPSLNDPSSERAERFFFPSSVQILDLLAGISSVPSLTITYKPPHPDVFVNTFNQSGSIILQSITLGTTKTITINEVGNVSIQ